jgi:TetR/AcrR family transcriptional repressor of nem operon
MGHSQAEKTRTHDRIVKVAARKFREKGLNGIGVADLMKEAGLTVGGFYKHFASKDQLITEAMGASFGGWEASIEKGERARESVRFGDLADAYLDRAHRDNPADGCAFAALCSDLGRSDETTRALSTHQLKKSLALLASIIDTDDASAGRAKAILAYCAMIGAVNLARLADDDALSTEILHSVRESLTSLIEKPASSVP